MKLELGYMKVYMSKLKEIENEIEGIIEFNVYDKATKKVMEVINKHYIPISEVEEIKEKYLEDFIEFMVQKDMDNIGTPDFTWLEAHKYYEPLVKQYKTTQKEEDSSS